MAKKAAKKTTKKTVRKPARKAASGRGARASKATRKKTTRAARSSPSQAGKKKAVGRRAAAPAKPAARRRARTLMMAPDGVTTRDELREQRIPGVPAEKVDQTIETAQVTLGDRFVSADIEPEPQGTYTVIIYYRA